MPTPMTALETSATPDTTPSGQTDHCGLARQLQTVVSIPATPFTDDGAIAEPSYLRLLQRLTTSGVSVVTANGNTGEYYALSQSERHRLVEITSANVPATTVVVAGVGLDVATAVADARAAVESGAHCIMVHHPIHPFRSPQGWVDYHRQIGDAVPGIGMIPYL